MEDPSSQTIYLQLFILFLLTLFNAFFSASEMALVSLIVRELNKKPQKGKRSLFVF